MHEIQIHYLVPLHDFVTLAIFEDRTLHITDCKLLRNRHRVLMPTLNPGIRDGTAPIPLELAPMLKAEIGQSDFQETQDGETFTFEVDADFYRGWQRWCHIHHISTDKMIQALLRFCTEENKTVVGLWFSDMQRQEMMAALEYARLHQFTQSQFERDFDEIFAGVESGISPVLIKNNDGHQYLLFEWGDYWNRFGWLHEPGERQRVEEECQKSDCH